MKLNRILIAAIAALTLASCSKDNSKVAAPGEKASLSIAISNPTRTAGVASTTDNVASNFVAFVFRADGSKDCDMISSATASPVNNVAVTTAATEVYVIANADAAVFSGITSKAQLLAKVNNSLDTQNGESKRWATGRESITFTQSGSDFHATVTVNLRFIAARIVVTVENKMTNYNLASGSLILTDVAVLNAVSESYLFGTSLIPATRSYFGGIASISEFTYHPASYTVKSYLTDSYVSGSTYHYYVYENNATKPEDFPTILTLIATYDGGWLYFPVHFASYEQLVSGDGMGIERGKSYNLNIVLNGDASQGSGGGGGVTDPTVPAVNSTMDVSISITDWTPVPMEKEFGN